MERLNLADSTSTAVIGAIPRAAPTLRRPSLPTIRINGSSLRVVAESLSPSQCVCLRFQKARRIPSARRGSVFLANGGSSAIAPFCSKTVRKRGGSALVRWLGGHAQPTQVTVEQDIVRAVEILQGVSCEADLISHLRKRFAFASRLRSPAITLSVGT